jgi:hypothetical protein
VRKPQEGSRIRRGSDRSGGSSRLRGAPRGSVFRRTRQSAWVDARVCGRSVGPSAGQSAGEEAATTAAATDRDKPWRGWEIKLQVHGRKPLIESELSGKGTALVAKGGSLDVRDPRPRDGAVGGSSGGQAARRDEDARRVKAFGCAASTWNPKSGLELSAGFQEIAGGEKRSRRRNARNAMSRGWQPGAAGTRSPPDAARDRNAEGATNPMRGGGTHWTRAEAKRRARWMSTGRARVMR